MMTLLYILVMGATFVLLSRVLPGIRVEGWAPAIVGAIVLAVVNAIIRPILFVLTLPLTILTLGLFLLVLNAITLKIASALVPGLGVDGWMTAIVAALVLSLVGMVWKAATKDGDRRVAA